MDRVFFSDRPGMPNPPAPPGGESIDQFSARIARFLTAERPCEHTVLVTHAGVIRVLQVMAGESWDVAMSTDYPFLSWNYHAVKMSPE